MIGWWIRCSRNGITPVATLYHWDLPLPLYRARWLAQPRDGLAFADYADGVARALGDRVQWWITQNEPWCQRLSRLRLRRSRAGHQRGHAGGGGCRAITCCSRMASPSRASARTPPRARIGIALNLFPIFANDQRAGDDARGAARRPLPQSLVPRSALRGEYPAGLFEDLGVAPPPIQPDDFEIIGTPTDFLGVNYYNRWMIRAGADGANGTDKRVGGHRLHPICRRDRHRHGVGDLPARPWYDCGRAEPRLPPARAAHHREWRGLRRRVERQRARGRSAAVSPSCAITSPRSSDAIAHGVPVAGYFVWSLFDNFEWARGLQQTLRPGLCGLRDAAPHRQRQRHAGMPDSSRASRRYTSVEQSSRRGQR